MRITVHIVDAFVDGDQGGNAAGVVLDAEHLSSAQKLKIAHAVGLSETAFVSPSSMASLRVEFFTPTRQIPHCGHATVATFSLCSQLGHLHDGEHVKESMDGILALSTSKGQVTLHQGLPAFRTLAIDSEIGRRVVASMGIRPSSVVVAHQLTVARAGNGFLLIPLESVAVLAGLQPDHPSISQICEELDLIGFYPYALLPATKGQAVTTRMFAPRYGIDEESATGTAAGPLGAYLFASSVVPMRCCIKQGHFMNPPSPSLLEVCTEINAQGTMTRVHVAGVGRIRTTMEVDVD